MQEILIYCAEHYRDQISLKRIAEDLHISPNHISSIFSQKLKISLRDYINNMRISDATHLLSHTEKSITEIMLGGDHYKWRQMRSNAIDESYMTGDKGDFEKFEAKLPFDKKEGQLICSNNANLKNK